MNNNCFHCGEDLACHDHRNLKCRGRKTVFRRAGVEPYVQALALATGGTIQETVDLPDGSGFAVVSIPRKPLLQRLWHYLVKCQTFWQWKRAFACPLCGNKYRCYWDGNDSDCGAGTSLCTRCARKHEGHSQNQCRAAMLLSIIFALAMTVFASHVAAQTFPHWPDNQTVRVYTQIGAFTPDEQSRINAAVESWRPFLPAGITLTMAGETSRVEECQGCVTLDRKSTNKEDWGYCQTVRDVATNTAMYTEISIDRRAGSNISFRIVAEHEIGHALGLEHRGKSVMDYHAATSWIHRHPSKGDAAILAVIYGSPTKSHNFSTASDRKDAVAIPQPRLPPFDISPIARDETANTEALKSHQWTLTVSIQTLDEDGKVNGDYNRISRVVLDDQGHRYERVLSKHSHLRGMRITKADETDFVGAQMGLIDFTSSRFTQGSNGAIHVEPVSLDKRGFSGDIWVGDKGIEKFIGTTLPEKSERFPMFTATRKEVEGHLFPSEMSSEGVLQFSSGAVRYRWRVMVSDYKLFGSRVSLKEVE